MLSIGIHMKMFQKVIGGLFCYRTIQDYSRPFSHLSLLNQFLYVSQNHADMGPAGITASIRATGMAGYVGVVPGDEV